MKYNVTYSCGHADEVQLYGKTSERERKIAWMERSGLCHDCYKAKMEAERSEEHAKQDAKAEAGIEHYGYPELAGTEKQVKWAKALREEAITAVFEMLACCDFPCDEQKLDTMIQMKIVETHTDSRYWIDNREYIKYHDSYFINGLIDEAVDAMGGGDAVIAACK